MTKRRESERGFTLLELLMVVIILAILAAIALPQFLRVAEKARPAEVLTLMATIRGSENRFRSADATAQYTTDFAALDVELPTVTPGGTPQNTITFANWSLAVSGTSAGSNIEATRLSGPYVNSKIFMDLDSGTTCADVTVVAGAPPANAAWGLTGGSC